MNNVTRPVYFDRTLFDNVVLAITTVDAFNGKIITKGVSAYIEKEIAGSFIRFPIKPVRNISGMLVFINRTNEPPLGSPQGLPATPFRIVIKAQTAGYFDPPLIMIAALPNDKKLLLRLHRLPSVAMDTATTSISGVVVSGAARVAQAIIKSIYPPAILPPNVQPDPFETLSDERGAFSLRMRLPVTPADIKIEISNNGQLREFDRNLTEGKAYAFESPIDLLGTNANNNPIIVALVT